MPPTDRQSHQADHNSDLETLPGVRAREVKLINGRRIDALPDIFHLPDAATRSRDQEEEEEEQRDF